MDRSLWEVSGTLGIFGDNMFTTRDRDGRVFAIKPMNCPGHVQVFKQGITSYRDLPVRLAEFGKVHRYEPSGALHGMMRVRAFTQDDAHIFCTPEQITEESIAVCELILDIYRDFGFDDVRIKFADRPEVRVGDDAVWDQAEAALIKALESTGLDVHAQPRRRRFLRTQARVRAARCHRSRLAMRHPAGGPEPAGTRSARVISAKTARSTRRSCCTARFSDRWSASSVSCSSITPGNLPLWLAPVQVKVLTITSDADDYAMEVVTSLRNHGMRAEADLRNEKISYKVREHSVAKIPVLFAVGQREVENRSVAIRRLGSKQQDVISLDDAIAMLKTEISNRGN